MAEIAPVGGGGANRTFLIIVLGLAAVLLIGLILAGALLALPALLGTRSLSAATTITPTRVAIAVATATVSTPVSTATPVLVAPSPTKTSTATATAKATSTRTPQPATAAPTQTIAVATETPSASEDLPDTGLGDDLLVLAVGLVLVVVVFAARSARTWG